MPIVTMLAVAALAAGCVAQYRVPSGAPAASVRLVTDTDDNTSFTVVDPSKCPEPARPLVLAGTGKQLSAIGRDRGLEMAGRSPESASRTRERQVEAGRRIYVGVSSTAAPPLPELRCAAGVSFVPEAGAQYEIRFKRDETASQCSAQVLQPAAAAVRRRTVGSRADAARLPRAEEGIRSPGVVTTPGLATPRRGGR
ncbi:hypothetical protein ACTMU2_11965 [Cupriavidus basilensis]